MLNIEAKRMPDNYRHYIYRLKVRYLHMLYRQGYCVQAVLNDKRIWCVKFRIDKKVFEWHMPEKVVTWHMEEISTGVHFEWREENEMPTRPLAEAVALIEWCLQA